MNTSKNEFAHAIHGVSGRMFARHKWDASRFSAQKWIGESRKISGYGKGAYIVPKIRFDDECRNGHNTFAITADISDERGRSVAGGCLHEDIAQVFPELAHLIKWHLCSTDGPMHYVADVCYLAGNRDYNGLLKGEVNPRHIKTVLQFGNNPITHELPSKFIKFLQDGPANFDYKVIGIEHINKPGETYKFSPHYTFSGFGLTWYDCPFKSEDEALAMLQALRTCDPKFVQVPTAWGEGKERELNKARNVAIWSEATDAELSVSREALTEKLNARLPALLAQFESDMRAAGFAWSPSEIERK